MSKKDDGGAAFPRQIDYRATDGCMMSKEEFGMTLRDYFATKAISSLDWTNPPKACAADAYRIADAMIAARKEEA